MSTNPFLITGPAIISFSGGRTSALMLYLILLAHGGRLPADVYVVFANTGKEREETLRFVHEVEVRWGVRIYWVEWRATSRRAARTASLAAWIEANDPERRIVNDEGFEVVGYNSASRNGEPFAALIAMKQRLPNWTERWCTEFLKVGVLAAFAQSVGFEEGAYQEIIGLRDDETHRILRSYENANFRWDRKTKKQVRRERPRLVKFPLALAKITKAIVLAFWLGPTGRLEAGCLPQGFDLGLQPHEGNCDLCFLKGKTLRKRLIRDVPGIAIWWNLQEVARGQWFDKRDTVRALIDQVRATPEFLEDEDDDEADAECGAACGGHLGVAA